jgi:hypothetical protein
MRAEWVLYALGSSVLDAIPESDFADGNVRAVRLVREWQCFHEPLGHRCDPGTGMSMGCRWILVEEVPDER